MTEEIQPKKSKLPLIIGIAGLGLTLLGAGGWWVWQQQQPKQTVAVDKPEAVPASALVKKPVFLPLSKFIISIPGDDRLHYMMLELSVMGFDQAQLDLISDYKPLVRNTVINQLSQKTYAELTEQGVMSKLEDELREHIRKVMNEMANSNGIDKVLITKMVIQ